MQPNRPPANSLGRPGRNVRSLRRASQIGRLGPSLSAGDICADVVCVCSRAIKDSTKLTEPTSTTLVPTPRLSPVPVVGFFALPKTDNKDEFPDKRVVVCAQRRGILGMRGLFPLSLPTFRQGQTNFGGSRYNNVRLGSAPQTADAWAKGNGQVLEEENDGH